MSKSVWIKELKCQLFLSLVGPIVMNRHGSGVLKKLYFED